MMLIVMVFKLKMMMMKVKMTLMMICKRKMLRKRQGEKRWRRESRMKSKGIKRKLK